MSRRHVVALLMATWVEAADYIQVLTYLLVSCQQEAAGRCRPGRPRIAGYVIYLDRVAEGGRAARNKHLPVEGAGCRAVVIPSGYGSQRRPAVGGNVVGCEAAAGVSLRAVNDPSGFIERTGRCFTLNGIGARGCHAPVARSMRLTLFTRVPSATPPNT